MVELTRCVFVVKDPVSVSFLFFFLTVRRPPISPTFPYTTLFRSCSSDLLTLSLELYHNGHIPLLALLGAMTIRPAELLGLDVGRLSVGAPADLLLFDLDCPWQIEVDAFHSKSKNSPFDGRPVQGRALHTVVGGRTVYRAG